MLVPAPDWRSVPGLCDLAERAAANGLIFSQAKFDRLWQVCDETGVPPLFMLAILPQEGTGSFNTSSDNRAGDGMNGIETEWEADVRKACHLVAGKLMLYPQAVSQGFVEMAQQVVSPTAGRCDGGPDQWVNWTSGIVRNSGAVDIGCYALHASWWAGVRQHYLNFGGSMKQLTGAAYQLHNQSPAVHLTMRFVVDDLGAGSNWNATLPEPVVIVTEVIVVPDVKPGTPTVYKQVPVKDAAGRVLCSGWLMDPDGTGPEGDRTVIRVADLAAALGLVLEWNGADRSVLLKWKGSA